MHSHVNNFNRNVTTAAMSAALVVGAMSAAASEVKPTGQQPVLGDVKTYEPGVSLVKPTKADEPAQGAAIPLSQPAPKAVALPGGMTPSMTPGLASALWDVQADGTIWARGNTYKASFGANGFTFIPYMGADAPQNYPTRFQVQQVNAGTQKMGVDGAAAAVRQGDTVVFDRGAFDEVYEVGADSIEQLFVFHTMPASGDLTVRMNVHTDLGKRQGGDELVFDNQRGGMAYTHAVALDATGARVQAPTALRNGQIEIVVPASFVASAQFPLTIDPVISSFSAAAGTPDAKVADVAYDASSDRYFVAWEIQFSAIDGDIYADTYDSNGNSLGTLTAIDSTTDNWRNPSCANNNLANQFLVAAEVGAAPSRVIMARTRAASNIGMSNPFTLSGAASGDKHSPAVGGDPHTVGPTYYCVAWQRDLTGTDTDIHARLVKTDGTNLTADFIALSNSGGTLDGNPAISKSNGSEPASGQAWTIVWERNYQVGDADIYGAQLFWDGAILHSLIPIDTTDTDDHNPSVSTVLDAPANGPRPYMVAYDEATAQNARDIYCRVWAGNTHLAGGNLSNLQNVLRSQDQITPAVDSDGQKFIVAHSEMFGNNPADYDIFVSSFCLDGNSIRASESRRGLDYSLEMASEPALASLNGSGASNGRVFGGWHVQMNDSQVGNIRAGFYTVKTTCDCIGDVVAPWGVVNVDDLLATINFWGVQGVNVPADANGDQVVNVDDLLTVINQWGNCP